MRERGGIRIGPMGKTRLSMAMLRISALAALLTLPSCSTLEFYRQAAAGQIEIIRKARPNEVVAADPATSAHLRERLAEVEEMRRFASEHLALPGDESYGRYADLGRKHVVWVVYAAPEFSVEPKTWFYPFVGSLDYRGYFNEADAEKLRDELKAEALDVHLGGVDAYSTLGVFHDPLLNTFIDYPDIHLAETIFHELTHRRYFRWGDTEFNECLANVVAEEGVRRWLATEGRVADLRKYEGLLVRRREFYQEIERSKNELETLYASGLPAESMRERKQVVFARLKQRFRELHDRWGGRGLEGWMEEDINNGHIVSLKIYAARMPEIRDLLERCGGDFDRLFKSLSSHHDTTPAP